MESSTHRIWIAMEPGRGRKMRAGIIRSRGASVFLLSSVGLDGEREGDITYSSE
jgi:hypothetical protein